MNAKCLIRIAASCALLTLIIASCRKKGDTEVSFESLDNAIRNEMYQYKIPALSVAIVRNEKLVYIKSYGFSDKESQILAADDDLYRIASVSKPITAIAILKLVQDGLLSLDQKVFGSDGVFGNDYGNPPSGSKKDLITVRHLLDHKSGWTNSPTDPMFNDITSTQSQLIADLLVNRPLTYTPGVTTYYLNFGYCLLGRVIEKITNMSYENYVESNILQPCGISDMKIGGNTLNDRYPKEVKYYQSGSSPYSPYNINVTRMDSHGGWIASTKDLARFIVKIDRNESKSDLISTTLLNKFYFGYPSWVHYGALPGASAILSRLDNTFSFIILANTCTDSNPGLLLDDLYNTVKGKINSISVWPSYDLF